MMTWIGAGLVVAGLLTLAGSVYLFDSVYQPPPSLLGVAWVLLIAMTCTIGFFMEMAGLFVLIALGSK